MVGADHLLDQRAALDTRICSAWRWWRCGDPRICPRWLAEHVIFGLTEYQPGLEYHLLTPSTLTIDRAMSCRLLEYIRSVATAPVP